MSVYRISFDAYNSRPGFPPDSYRYRSVRVTFDVRAFSRADAVRSLRTVFVSSDYSSANLTGGLPGGFFYPERENVLIRQVSADRARPEGTGRVLTVYGKAS